MPTDPSAEPCTCAHGRGAHLRGRGHCSARRCPCTSFSAPARTEEEKAAALAKAREEIAAFRTARAIGQLELHVDLETLHLLTTMAETAIRPR
jgi:hypothetical protein